MPSRVGLAKMAQSLLPKGVQNLGIYAHLSPVDGRRTWWMVDAPERDRKQGMEKVSGDVGWQVDGRRMLE